MNWTETQRQRRGHDFLPPAADLARIPPHGATGHFNTGDIPIHLHYTAGGSDWWIAELEEDDDGQLSAYGYVRLAEYPAGSEWGTIWLHQLERATFAGGLVIVERDLLWTPRTFSEVTR